MLFRKGLYPYEFMDDWEKFNETSLQEHEEFYSNLNMEDITDLDYNHVKRIWISWFAFVTHYLLTYVFENFRKSA